MDEYENSPDNGSSSRQGGKYPFAGQKFQNLDDPHGKSEVRGGNDHRERKKCARKYKKICNCNVGSKYKRYPNLLSRPP